MRLGSFAIFEKYVVKNDEGEPYLIRYRLLRTPWFGIYLHRILRSDDDRHLHDHPFNFTTIILWNGYEEVTPGDWKWRGVGSVIRHQAKDYHRLIVPEGKTTWSLFIRGRKYREWGFATSDGWIPHDQYMAYKMEKASDD